jgi:hypothetical protein
MNTLHDIYDPPPAPLPLAPPKAPPLPWTVGDLVPLALLALPVSAAALWAWAIDRTLGFWVSVAGAFMLLESWLSALTFLQRHPLATAGRGRRWLIFLAAFVPWILCLVFGVALMLGLFALSDSGRL